MIFMVYLVLSMDDRLWWPRGRVDMHMLRERHFIPTKVKHSNLKWAIVLNVHGTFSDQSAGFLRRLPQYHTNEIPDEL